MSTTPVIHKLGIYIGRFAPFHMGHQTMLEYAQERSHKVLVLIGSATQGRSLYNPFNAEERRRLVPAAHVDTLRDYPYCDELWIKQVENKVRHFMTSVGWERNKTEITLYGARGSEWYTTMFPNWNVCTLKKNEGNQEISATRVRELYFGGTFDGCPPSNAAVDMLLKIMVPATTYKFMKTWQQTNDYLDLYNGRERGMKLKAQFGDGPFIATDSVVIHGDELLVVTRGQAPGKGQLALPGGYLESDLTLIANAKKEVTEETNVCLVGVPPKAHRVFDAVNRSAGSRIVSYTYKFDLTPVVKPKVKGGDDASDAFWIKIKDAVNAPECFHDDHVHIIEEMTGVRG
jgi:bifunctional NMN adenylyltransferase/nudix hydrolase